MLQQAFQLLSPAGGRGRLSTLIFHRVLPQADALFPDELDAARFERVCAWIRRWFNVLPLDQAVRRLASGQLPARAMAITFDDGYADNHDVALPILQRHGLPATFFIATGFLDGGRMWNDTVIEALRRSRKTELDLGGLGLEGLGRVELGSAGQRRTAIDAAIRAVKYLPPSRRMELVQQIAELAGTELPDNLMMRSDQVRALHRAGMQLGPHTVNHPILARLAPADVRSEIGESKRQLEAIVRQPSSLFAYPNGKPGEDYTDETVEIAREFGFDAAVSTAWGAARRDSDLFQLPRFTPWDCTRTRFGVRLLRNLWVS